MAIEAAFGSARPNLRSVHLASFDDSAAAVYGRIRHELELIGSVIGPYDLMIAAIAQSNQLTLVTHTTSEFGRIRGLSIEDWQT